MFCSTPNHGLLIFQDFHENEGGGGGGGKSDWQYVLESIDRLNRLVMANESSFAPFSLRGEIEDFASKSGLATNANFVLFSHGGTKPLIAKREIRTKSGVASDTGIIKG